jgi:hypothetical protein
MRRGNVNLNASRKTFTRPGPTPNPDLIKMLGSGMFSHPVLADIQDPCTFGPAIIRYLRSLKLVKKLKMFF